MNQQPKLKTLRQVTELNDSHQENFHCTNNRNKYCKGVNRRYVES